MEPSHCFVPTFQQDGGPHGFEHLGGAHAMSNDTVEHPEAATAAIRQSNVC
jgi:hypothetical protein